MRTHAIVPVLALTVLAGLGSVGCSKQLQHTVLQNQPPVVRLTWAPIDTQSEVFYIYKLSWVGYDPDGRVTRFEYAVDPPRGPGGVIDWTNATSTTKNEETIRFESATPESAFKNSSIPRSQGFHVFAIRAVDNGDPNAFSEPVERAFYSFGVAPTVQILEPQPQTLLTPRVTPAARVTWVGKDFVDPNGAAFEKPLYYKYTLFKKGNPGVHWNDWIEEPDLLRREVAPEFAGWDSIAPEVPEVQFTNLTTNSEYLFVIVAFGRSGAYSPIFTLRSNMLRMYVGLAGELGPKITLFNTFFQYTYPTGGWSLDPSQAIPLQVPAEVSITFNWIAEAPEGSIMRRYRWVLDLVALDDETPRSSQSDLFHWSPWSQATAATIPAFSGAEGDEGEIHNFYVEAEDVNGLVSLGWVQFRVYRPAFDKDLLVVNDTRFPVDVVWKFPPDPLNRPDSLQAPFGQWPSRAELDTFLFAVGGKPWKMKTGNPPSPQGLFRGYSFDTLGTRYGRVIPTAPLGLLGHYRNIVWMTDKAAGYELAANSATMPQPTLLYMSAPGRQNTLSTWVSQGGKLWALGGGFGHVTNKLWNNNSNDANQIRTYRYDGVRPDLTPGRFMYDLAHWRTQFRSYGPVFVRFSRYDQPDPTVIGSPKPPTYWKGGTFTNPEVDYTALPTTLQFRSPTTDPLWIWPDRTSSTEYYVGNRAYSSIGVDIEFLSVEHKMLEQIPTPTEENPDLTVERSTLDSLYLVYGPGYPKQMNQSSAGEGVNVVMTYYHGRDNAPLVFSGMSIWDFRRTDCQALVDFVLGDLWGLPKNTVYTAPRASAASFARRVAVPTPTPRPRPTPTPTQRTFQRPPGAVRQPVGTSTFQRWR